jgi:hypothetical protein
VVLGLLTDELANVSVRLGIGVPNGSLTKCTDEVVVVHFGRL